MGPRKDVVKAEGNTAWEVLTTPCIASSSNNSCILTHSRKAFEFSMGKMVTYKLDYESGSG